MADKIRFLTTSNLDSATLSSSSETSGLPDTNVQDNLVRKVYRTQGITQEWIVFDVGAATTVNQVSIFNHTFTKDAVLKWQAHTSDSWAAPDLNTTITVPTDTLGNPVKRITHFYSSGWSYQYWRLLVQDTGNACSTLDVGRVMAGRYIEPTINMRDGFSFDFLDPSRGTMTAGRQAYWNEKDPYAEISYSLMAAEEPQINQMRAIFNDVGMHTAFALAINPDSRPHHDTFYTQFNTNLNLQQRLLRQYDIANVVFQEKN